MISSLPVWGVVLSSLNGRERSQNSISLLSALSTTSPALALIAALAFFSLAGIPPLAGFYSKVFVFFSAIKASFYFSAFIVLGISVISTYYYISVVKTIYFEKNRNWLFYRDLSKESSVLLSLSLVFLVFIFINPNLFLLFSQKMALSVF
jgi:NADH-quinone oxidoreductase subunit N